MSQVPDDDLEECIKTRSVAECVAASQEGELVSPSGKSIVESVISREEDPTIQEFQQARGDFFKGIVDFFQGILKCNFVGIPCWIIIVAVIILVLVAIIKGR